MEENHHPVIKADKFKLLTQKVHLNPTITEIPTKVTHSTNLHTPICSSHTKLPPPPSLNPVTQDTELSLELPHLPNS